MRIIVYDKNTNKIEHIYDVLNINDIKLKENEAILNNENIKDFTQKDVRVYNKDGSVKSLEQQVKEKIITLKDNEVIDNGTIRELNKSYTDDYIILIERGLEKLDDRQKIVTNGNGTKYITEKTYDELFKENLITADEYNQYIISIRQSRYINDLDGERAELLENVLSNLASKDLLTEKQKQQLESLKVKRQNIKTQYKKV